MDFVGAFFNGLVVTKKRNENMTSAFAEGRLAFSNGKKISENPYTESNTDYAQVWVTGWNDAFRSRQEFKKEYLKLSTEKKAWEEISADVAELPYQLSMVGLGRQTGFKRLALLITAVAFWVTYLILYIVEESNASVREGEAFIEFPVVSAVVAGIIWGLVKATYWVIDGFKNPDS